MMINEAKRSTAPVLPKESDIPEASLAGRRLADLGKANLLFGGHLSVIVNVQLVKACSNALDFVYHTTFDLYTLQSRVRLNTLYS